MTAVGVKFKPRPLAIEEVDQRSGIQTREIGEPFEDKPRCWRVLRVPVNEAKPQQLFKLPIQTLTQIGDEQVDKRGRGAA